jgi:hypothetical protein
MTGATEKGTLGKLIDWGQRTGDREQSRETGDRGRETRNRAVRWRTGDKKQSHKTGDRGRETRSRAVRQGTEDGSRDIRHGT